MRNEIFILDGNSILNRAFYALPNMTNYNGLPLNAVYGFINVIIKLIEAKGKENIIVCFDYGRKTFRNEIFTDYKGTRKAAPDSLVPQFSEIRRALNVLGVKFFEKEGWEADDLIGTFANKFKEENDIKIISGDKDLYQLVDDNTTVLFTKKGITELLEITPKNIEEVYGVTAPLVVDLKAIMGDSSDNIPGVAGIGQVGALKLIKQYGNLDNIYENIDEITGSTKTKLIAGKEAAYMSRDLATIRVNADIDESLKVDDTLVSLPLKSSVKELFMEYEFKSMLKKAKLFSKDEVNDAFIVENESELIEIESENELIKLIEKMKEIGYFSMHLAEDKLFLACDEKKGYVVSLAADLLSMNLNEHTTFSRLKHLLEDANIDKIFFDKKEMYYELKKRAIKLGGGSFSLVLAEHLLNGTRSGDIDVATLAKRYGLNAKAGKAKRRRDDRIIPRCRASYDRCPYWHGRRWRENRQRRAPFPKNRN